MMQELFPTGEGFCTRLAILLRLRRSQMKDLRIGIGKQVVENLNDEHLIRFKYVNLKHYSVDDPLLSKEVKNLMNQALEGEKGVREDCQLFIEFHSPNVPNLDIIDLPGLLAYAGVGIPDETPEKIANLVDFYLSLYKDRCMVLAITDSKTPPNQSLAFQFIKSHQLEKQTIGVITKCDLLRDENQVEDLIRTLNQQAGSPAVHLPTHGYIATTLAQIGRRFTLTTQFQAEEDWFRENLQSEQQEVFNRCGVNQLINRLSLMTHDHHIIHWQPKTVDLLNKKLLELSCEVLALGMPQSLSLRFPI